jgi:arylsulfatase A-like enzyme
LLTINCEFRTLEAATAFHPVRVAILAVSCLLTSAIAAQEEVPSPDSQPNILIITADNLGYGDLQSYNPDSKIRTPNLDRLATQGARLTGFYTASPTCTVSRACLLTGRIPQRHGLVDQLGGVAGNYGIGLSHDEVLIPQILKTAPTPYATGCFGKWNIGFAPGSRPTGDRRVKRTHFGVEIGPTL